MSEVKFIPDENTLTLDEEGICELVIENRGKAIIYKIKSNLGDKVQVNHVYGVIGRNVNQNCGKIVIKYIGVRESIQDVRVKIYWLQVEETLSKSQLGRQQFTQMYASSRQKSQQWSKGITLKVTESPFRSSIIKKFNIMESEELRFSSRISNQEKNIVKEVCQSLSKMKHERQHKKEKDIKEVKKQEQNTDRNLSMKNLIILLTFVFILGISFGIRIYRSNQAALFLPEVNKNTTI